MTVQLRVSAPDGRMRRLQPGEVLLVGRVPDAGIRFDEPDVSGRHAEIRMVDGAWMLVDLQSRNGTFAGPTRIGSWPVIDGAEVCLGAPGSTARLLFALIAAADPGGAALPDLTAPAPAGVGTVVRSGGGGHGSAEFLIGRDPACEYRVTDDLLISRKHASLRVTGDGTGRVRDLSSTNGTFVDGVRARNELPIRAGQRITVGNSVFRFDGAALHLVEMSGAVAFAAHGLTVGTPPSVRLDRVSFWLPERTFLAVLGTSGAGKSTLLKAITGMDPAGEGRVIYDGRDLYASYGELRRRIGYVPQDDVLHPQLTVAETMEYGARLRFPPDVSAEERSRRVAEVLDELGLTERAGLQVARLSGGQRKRLSVGLELLTRPSLLILDEPTSGLDPGNERIMMGLLRQLADGGRTVIVVTHATESLHLVDRVLFLARGGVPVYFGPPGALPDHFEVRDYPEVFDQVDHHPQPTQLRERFLRSSFARELDSALGVDGTASPGQAPPGAVAPAALPAAKASSGGLVRQTALLTGRYVRVLRGDRRSLAFLLLQGPLIAVLMLAVFGSGHLDAFAGPDREAGNVLMALVLASIYTGSSNSVREVVKERAILRREQNFGLSALAFLLSKVIGLGAVTVAQAALLVLVGTARQGGPVDALVLGSPKLELTVSLALCGLSAMALGLLISTVVTTADKAMTVLPVALFTQFLLAGLVFDVDRPGIEQVSWLMGSRWGLAAVASVSDLPALSGCAAAGSGLSLPGDVVKSCPVGWSHVTGTWMLDLFALAGLTVLALVAAWLMLVRGDPEQVLRKRAGR
jgi:ABC-type multidrug transport system ATPase subunit/pSer/pThr/pTyr-binding forkhead associated (FHA) protein